VSVQTGIGPRELLELDAEMFEAIAEAANRHWPIQLELAATSLEVQHAHLLAYLATHTKRGTPLPEPLHVRRPEEDVHERPAPVSVSELAALPGLTAELRRVK
jgi:hypothetical protein